MHYYFALGMGCVIDRVPWAEVDERIGVQCTNREAHFPAVSVFRWWARRQHPAMGAILDAAQAEFGAEGLVVSDPFSGGGTVAIEAVRRGLPVYAQDLYPWPVRGLAAALNPAPPELLEDAARRLLEALEPYRAWYQRQEGGDVWEATHVLRVRVIPCPHCDVPIHLFREPLVSMASRGKNEKFAFFGCRSCGSVSRRRADVRSFGCAECSRRWPARQKERPRPDALMGCPHCRRDVARSSVRWESATWRPVLLQERSPQWGRKMSSVLRPVREGDPVDDVEESPEEEEALRLDIPDGLETRHLLLSGYRRWADLYTHRQLRTLVRALALVRELDHPQGIKDRLALAVLGASEMPGYLCRWDRHNPKVFEAMANHRYARHTQVAVEANMLSPVGRGTLPRRLLAAQKALSWLLEGGPAPSRIRVRPNGSTRRRLEPGGVLLATGSSAEQGLEDGSARLVLTDPPYHDDVQYGELARLFHVWLGAYDREPANPDEHAEAAPNPTRGADTQRYEDVVAECLAESRRTLAEGGRLILTFHNNDIAAWEALSNALRRSGFRVVGLAVVDAENAADHSKRGKKAFLCDLVIECVATAEAGAYPEVPRVSTRADTDQRKNLLAAGLAVAEAINSRRADKLGVIYRRHLDELGGAPPVLIR